MRIRLAITLDMRREPKQEPESREVDIASAHERSETGPLFGFRPNTLDPEEGKQ